MTISNSGAEAAKRNTIRAQHRTVISQIKSLKIIPGNQVKPGWQFDGIEVITSEDNKIYYDYNRTKYKSLEEAQRLNHYIITHICDAMENGYHYGLLSVVAPYYPTGLINRN